MQLAAGTPGDRGPHPLERLADQLAPDGDLLGGAADRRTSASCRPSTRFRDPGPQVDLDRQSGR